MIIIALGANLPSATGASPLASCDAAAVALGALPGLRLAALSRWYRTDPIPPLPGAPPYINGVARLEGTPPAPRELLTMLQRIEAEAGRERPFPNAPRTLDLDIIDLDGLCRAAPDPILPHPRAHLRRFVLEPLRDVAPGWVHPILHRSVEELLADLADQASAVTALP
ncbi:2-amino-4-hydroxy-6-hydroxymethyldihydropteridine diphosphokinase [Roseicella sp. DB1501]|uniref:2-amino-4-hydroxy-6- hydroxymethyldihydropteridine diphosphokinase n=1 Tax=Roseicella sp. DB1501 TaxID=2730925 RepID=UPI0034A09274